MMKQSDKYKQIQKQRMKGFDIDYPVIKKIKEQFGQSSVSSDSRVVTGRIPLPNFEKVLKHPELEKDYVGKIVKQLRAEEQRLAGSISSIEFREQGRVDIDARNQEIVDTELVLRVVVKKSNK